MLKNKKKQNVRISYVNFVTVILVCYVHKLVELQSIHNRR